MVDPCDPTWPKAVDWSRSPYVDADERRASPKSTAPFTVPPAPSALVELVFAADLQMSRLSGPLEAG
ncbi:hypothetical protein ATE48_07405 [Candidatus Viadribacter manganicus]|uniref:Uncharacterized protein n=1 Tax=Candidatus Viadribacter manganicus TaxID=1759059 RepID=A0A1B1AGS6_9PROT|nr:hypothetical protein ATE48_07405 [Candidatus Viadribacter manganicus]